MTYRAIEFNETGCPREVLKLVEKERVELRAGELRVRLWAAPINPADLNLIEGTYGLKANLPAIPGIEGAGEVIESRSDLFAVGDSVFFLDRAHSWAEECVVPDTHLVPLPRGIDPLQASMLKVNPQTAMRLLTDFQSLGSGDWVIQNAGNSGVGRCVIQLAKLIGVRTLSLVRRESLIPELESLGGDVVLLDEKLVLEEWMRKHEDVSFALGFNAVGGESALRLMRGLAPKGCLVTYGAMSKKPLTLPNGYLIFKRLRLEGLWVTEWLKETPRSIILASYHQLASWVNAGELTQAIDSVYSMEDYAEAIEQSQREQKSGKVLLRF